MKLLLLFVIVYVSTLLLTACPPSGDNGGNPTPASSATPTATQSPTSTPVPTATSTASPEPTVVATATPEGTPSKCPCLVRWGIGKKPHILIGKDGQLTDKPEAGGRAVYDTTPRFSRFEGDSNGGPCNGEHDNCKGRKCEDLRGPIFEVTGPSSGNTSSNVFQYKIAPLKSGLYTIKSLPRLDLKDALGVSVELCYPSASDQTTLDVP